MNNFYLPDCLSVIAITIVGFVLGQLVGELILDDVKEKYQKPAIENNCAQYNPTTGNFEWTKR